jgi:hypothetical protein
LPKISVENGEIKLGGAAVIKDFKLAGWLSEAQVRGYLWPLGEAAGAELTVNFGAFRIPLSITEQTSQLTLYEADGGIQCVADIRAEGEVGEYRLDGADIFSDATLKALQTDCERIIAEELSATHALFRDAFAVDGFELKEHLRKYRHDLYVKYIGDWDAVYRKLEITPRVRVVVRHMGQVK